MLKEKSESPYHVHDYGEGELCPYERADFLSDIQIPICFKTDLKLADKVFPYILQIFIVRTRTCER